jgi:STE24 endopeptidase
MADIIFWVIIIIVLLDFIFEKTLDYMNYKHLKETIPDELKGIYDEEAYKKSQQYEKVNLRFSFYTGSFSLLLILFMLFAGGFSLLDEWVRYISDNIYVKTLLFF